MLTPIRWLSRSNRIHSRSFTTTMPATSFPKPEGFCFMMAPPACPAGGAFHVRKPVFSEQLQADPVAVVEDDPAARDQAVQIFDNLVRLVQDRPAMVDEPDLGRQTVARDQGLDQRGRLVVAGFDQEQVAGIQQPGKIVNAAGVTAVDNLFSGALNDEAERQPGFACPCGRWCVGSLNPIFPLSKSSRPQPAGAQW